MDIKISITDDEAMILNHDLLDIQEWVSAAVQGKINNCRKRAAIAYRNILKEQGAEFVPTDDTQAAKALFSQKDYKNRATREVKG